MKTLTVMFAVILSLILTVTVNGQISKLEKETVCFTIAAEMPDGSPILYHNVEGQRGDWAVLLGTHVQIWAGTPVVMLHFTPNGVEFFPQDAELYIEGINEPLQFVATKIPAPIQDIGLPGIKLPANARENPNKGKEGEPTCLEDKKEDCLIVYIIIK